MLKRFLITAGFLISVWAALPAPAAAEEVSVEASISANHISLKDAAQLVLTVHGAKDELGPLQLPKIDGLDSQYMGPSTSVSIVNGRYSSEHSFTYNLFPNKTGHIQIPALTVSVGGKDYTTTPIDLQVDSAPAENAPASGQSAQPAAGQPLTEQNIKDRIFIRVSVPKASVYLGQRLPLRIKLLVNNLPLRNIQFPQLEKNGFTMEDIPQPKQYTQLIGGLKFDVVDFQTHIYPTRTGQVTIGPVQLAGSLLYKTQRQGPPAGFFNDDFFNMMFDNYQQRPLTLTSQPMNIQVLPLPEEGKPADFSGGVGQLDFTASAGPAQVKVGDPVTLRMKVSGQGNFKSVQMPVFSQPGFKTYDPQIKDEADAKTLEQVIIPTSENIKEVPAVHFSYFDPEAGGYKTITQGPFPLTVAAPAPGQEFKAVGFNQLPQASGSVQQVDYVQKYIRDPWLKMLAAFKTLRFWLAVLGILLLWGLWMAWSYYQRRLANDQSFARRLNAIKNARQGLVQAQQYLSAGRSKEMYDTLARTLSNYLGDQFNRPGAAMTWPLAQELLERKNVPPPVTSDVKDIYEACDLVRFAGGQADPGRMSQDLAKLQAIIPTLEKSLK